MRILEDFDDPLFPTAEKTLKILTKLLSKQLETNENANFINSIKYIQFCTLLSNTLESSKIHFFFLTIGFLRNECSLFLFEF